MEVRAQSGSRIIALAPHREPGPLYEHDRQSDGQVQAAGTAVVWVARKGRSGLRSEGPDRSRLEHADGSRPGPDPLSVLGPLTAPPTHTSCITRITRTTCLGQNHPSFPGPSKEARSGDRPG